MTAADNLYDLLTTAMKDRTEASRLVLADCLEEMGDERAEKVRNGRWLMTVHQILDEQPETNAEAYAFHAAIAKVDMAGVKVVCTDRLHDRKEVAKLVRKLFKSLGLPHVSVTTPRYSMASGVDVLMPARSDYTHRHPDGSVDFPSDPAAQDNQNAEDVIASILAIAFPNHDDRSDSMTDYFDSRWHITSK